MENGDFAGDGADEVHVVFDDHDGMLAFQREQQFGGALDFLRRHAGDGLVDQQHLRVLHEQHADLEPLLLAVRQRACAHVSAVLQPDRFEDMIDAFALNRIESGEERVPDGFLAGCGELEVLEHGVMLEDRRLLEFSADPRLGDLRLGEREQIDALAEPR